MVPEYLEVMGDPLGSRILVGFILRMWEKRDRMGHTWYVAPMSNVQVWGW